MRVVDDGAISGESVRRAGVKRKFLDLQYEYRAKRRRVPTNFAEAIELTRDLLQSADAVVNVVSSSDVLITTDGCVTTLAAELDKAKAPILELDSTETITFCWSKELLEEVK